MLTSKTGVVRMHYNQVSPSGSRSFTVNGVHMLRINNYVCIMYAWLTENSKKMSYVEDWLNDGNWETFPFFLVSRNVGKHVTSCS